MPKTKIICTMGPSTDNPEVIEEMVKAGMNVARVNFSHGSHEEQLKRINMIKMVTEWPEVITRGINLCSIMLMIS